MSDIDISREAVEQLALLHLKEGDNFSSLTAITLRALRAALAPFGKATE
jgi:hypothetical protein